MTHQDVLLGTTITVLKGAQVLIQVLAVIFFVVLGFTFFGHAELFSELSSEAEVPDAGQAIAALRISLVLWLIAAAAAWALFSFLLAIVRSVGRGDPFIPENARHLRAIGFSLIVFQFAYIGAGLAKKLHISPDEGVDWVGTIPGWLAILLIFVLARVFEEGARMREELEGTV